MSPHVRQWDESNQLRLSQFDRRLLYRHHHEQQQLRHVREYLRDGSDMQRRALRLQRHKLPEWLLLGQYLHRADGLSLWHEWRELHSVQHIPGG